MSRRSLLARPLLAFAALFSSLTGACVPYGVGTTALPVPRDSTVPTMLVTAIPSIRPFDSTRSAPYMSIDMELRRGIDSVSDAGIRLVSGYSGLVVNYKRLLTRTNEPALIAVMPGLGLINGAEHAHFELTLLASRRESRFRDGRVEQVAIVPYGGVRVMQVAPLSDDAVHDETTTGAFVGVRLGRPAMSVSPEIGVFYDRSALGHRRSNIIVVPTLSVHGDQLLEALRRLGTLRPRPGVW